MKKNKTLLQDLKIESVVTTLDPEQMKNVKGGNYFVAAKRYNFRTRWTSIDTRLENPQRVAGADPNGG